MEPSRKRRILIVLAGLAFLGGLLLPAEIWARRKWPPERAAVGSDPEFDYFHLQIHDPFFKLERRFGLIPYRYRAQRERAGVQWFSAWKGPNTLRVFVIGGSVAIGFNDHERTRIREFLQRSLPGRDVEIVGCGMGGYDSYRESLVEAEVLRYRPDLIVLMSGNNEYAPALRVNAPLFRLNRLLRESRLYQKLQDSSRPERPEALWPLEDRLLNFQKNLELMVARAQKRKVPLVICTLPVNIRDVPPTFSPEPANDADYYRARALLDGGRYRDAADGFARYLDAHPKEPYAHYWRGKALDLAGSGASARREYLKAVDLDDPGTRCSPRRNAIIRGLAREDGVAVADVEQAFVRAVPDGLTDARLFKDDVHWYDEYYPLVALAIVQAAAEYDRTHDAPMLAPPEKWNRWWDAGFEDGLSHPALDEERRSRYAEEVLISGVGKIFQSDGFVESALAYFAMAERLRGGILERALSSPDWLQARSDASPWLAHVRPRLKGEWFRVLAHAGEASRRMGRFGEARRYLDEALRLSPGDPSARLSRGLLELSTGDGRGASADLRFAADAGSPGIKARVASERTSADVTFREKVVK